MATFPYDDSVEFVPGWDLLEREEARLQDDDLALIAASLVAMLPKPPGQESVWAIDARIAAANARSNHTGDRS